MVNLEQLFVLLFYYLFRSEFRPRENKSAFDESSSYSSLFSQWKVFTELFWKWGELMVNRDPKIFMKRWTEVKTYGGFTCRFKMPIHSCIKQPKATRQVLRMSHAFCLGAPRIWHILIFFPSCNLDEILREIQCINGPVVGVDNNYTQNAQNGQGFWGSGSTLTSLCILTKSEPAPVNKCSIITCIDGIYSLKSL